MDSKCKPANNKYLDHLYCHTNDGKNYIRANNTGNSNTGDVMALLKENKQLKAMLILHLDLIQEQSDQLLAKDKLLTTFREENESLKQKNEHLERQQQQIQRQQNSSKRSANGNNTEMMSLLPPPLAKIQGKVDNRQPQIEHQNSESTTIAEEVSHGKVLLKRNYKIQEAIASDIDSEVNPSGTSIIGECNGKFISKIILHRINVPGMSPSTASDSASEIDETALATNCEEQIESIETPQGKRNKKSITIKRTAICAQAVEKHEKIDSDESISCDSINEKDQQSLPRVTTRLQQPQQKSKRCGYLTTTQLYCTREWEDEDFCDEFIKEEAKALKADAPMLEIPKWTVHDFNASYSIEGTEDLSDETFLKRHAKLEYDEKRRKKWDVQQIREQRRIERLKRRHCKDELRDATVNAMQSFYPQPNSIQAITFVSDLPVLAFGEGVPSISANTDFTLPWHQQQFSSTVEVISSSNLANSNSMTTNSSQIHQQKSSFVFMKKRRRQQSVSLTQLRSRTPRASTNNSVLSQASSAQQTTISTDENTKN